MLFSFKGLELDQGNEKSKLSNRQAPQTEMDQSWSDWGQLMYCQERYRAVTVLQRPPVPDSTLEVYPVLVGMVTDNQYILYQTGHLYYIHYIQYRPQSPTPHMYSVLRTEYPSLHYSSPSCGQPRTLVLVVCTEYTLSSSRMYTEITDIRLVATSKMSRTPMRTATVTHAPPSQRLWPAYFLPSLFLDLCNTRVLP